MPSQEEQKALTFNTKVLHDIFKKSWKRPKTKVGKEALTLSAEYLRIFTTQAVIRATNEAMNETGGGSLIRLEVAHLEKVDIIIYVVIFVKIVTFCLSLYHWRVI